MKHIVVILKHVLSYAKEYFQGDCHHFLLSATEVPEKVQLVLNMELLAISSMSEVTSEH